MYGIEGDISLKVRFGLFLHCHANETSLSTLNIPQSEALRLADEVGKREKHVTALFNNAGYARPYFLVVSSDDTFA